MAHADYRLLYGSAAATVRVELPDEYAALSTPKISVFDASDGSTVLAATNATYWTASTLGATATAGNRSVQLAVGATGPNPGDFLRIALSAAGAAENIRVQSYNSTNRTITTVDPLVESHSNGTAITGRFMSYSINISNTTTFPVDTKLVFKWAPNTVDLPITELGEIYKQTFEPITEDEFAALYPHVAPQIPAGKFAEYRNNAEIQLHRMFQIRGRDFHKIISGSEINDIIMMKIAHHVAVTRGDTWDGEAEKYGKYLNNEVEQMCAADIWVDEDQDDTEDAGENTTTDVWIGRNL